MGVLAEECTNLDSLVADAPETLRTIRHAEPGHDTHDGTVFLVGYSPEREAFAAFAFCAERNEFEPEELVAPHVMPARLPLLRPRSSSVALSRQSARGKPPSTGRLPPTSGRPGRRTPQQGRMAHGRKAVPRSARARVRRR